jgi:hypothetical protein
VTKGDFTTVQLTQPRPIKCNQRAFNQYQFNNGIKYFIDNQIELCCSANSHHIVDMDIVHNSRKYSETCLILISWYHKNFDLQKILWTTELDLKLCMVYTIYVFWTARQAPGFIAINIVYNKSMKIKVKITWGNCIL